MLETLDYTIRIGSTPTFLYFDLYLYFCLSFAHFPLINIIIGSKADLRILFLFNFSDELNFWTIILSTRTFVSCHISQSKIDVTALTSEEFFSIIHYLRLESPKLLEKII